MIEILVFTAGRSDFGILKKLIKKINLSKQFNLTLVIGPAHNTNIFGSTNQEIKEIKIKNKINLNFKKNNSNKFDILNSMSQIIKEISIKLKKKYTAAIVLGDRYESLNFAQCCFNLRIPIIHIGGGSISLGSLDDIYRKCISQMAKLHFVETVHNKKKNLENIGIKKNIFITGALALDNIAKKKNPRLIFGDKFDEYIHSKKKKNISLFSS